MSLLVSRVAHKPRNQYGAHSSSLPCSEDTQAILKASTMGLEGRRRLSCRCLQRSYIAGKSWRLRDPHGAGDARLLRSDEIES